MENTPNLFIFKNLITFYITANYTWRSTADMLLIYVCYLWLFLTTQQIKQSGTRDPPFKRNRHSNQSPNCNQLSETLCLRLVSIVMISSRHIVGQLLRPLHASAVQDNFSCSNQAYQIISDAPRRRHRHIKTFSSWCKTRKTSAVQQKRCSFGTLTTSIATLQNSSNMQRIFSKLFFFT